MISALVLALAFAAADRFCGGGLGWNNSQDGRPIYYVAAPAFIGFVIWFAGWLAFAWPPVDRGLLVTVWAWIAWRSFGWRPGKMDPRTPEEIGLTLLRHLPLAAPSLVGHPFALAAPVVATLLAVWLARQAAKGKDVNPAVETLRGAAYGLLAGL